MSRSLVANRASWMPGSLFHFPALFAGLLLVATPCAVRADESTTGSVESVPIAEVRGEVLDSDEFNYFLDVLRQIEGQGTQPDAAIIDFVLQELIDDVYTTVTSPHAALSGVPSPYTIAIQRNYLKNRMNDRLNDGIEVSRDEMDAWFDQNRDKYVRPERVFARHIFMQVSEDVPTSTPDRVRARMTEVREAFESGRPFTELAAEYSESESGRRGGEIGWLTYRQPVGPERRPINILLDDALFALPEKKISSVVETRHGLHVLYVDQRETTRTPTVDDLITSGVLPEVIKRDKFIQLANRTASDLREKLGSELLITSATQDIATTAPAFTIGGDTFTIDDFITLYGPRFRANVERMGGDPDRVGALVQQMAEDEAYVRAAIEAGIDKSPEVQRTLKTIGKRSNFRSRFDAILAEAFETTEEQARELYEAEKFLMRRPEGQGFIVTIRAEEPEDARQKQSALDEAKAAAEKVRERLAAGEDPEPIAQELSKDVFATSGGLVMRHILGEHPENSGRQFGLLVQGLAPGEVSEVRQFGDDFVVAKLAEKWPGEPAPFENVRGRFIMEARRFNEARAKREILDALIAEGKLKWLDGAPRFGLKTLDD